MFFRQAKDFDKYTHVLDKYQIFQKCQNYREPLQQKKMKSKDQIFTIYYNSYQTKYIKPNYKFQLHHPKHTTLHPRSKLRLRTEIK